MIEIICKDEPEKSVPNDGDETVFLPKNIRQVGSPRGRHKIYLEDYVYTYLRGTSKNNEKCAAVFLGKSRVVKDIRYTFISGVVECSAAVFQWENISLDDSFWDYIYKEQKQFFPELDIVGWVLGKAGQAMELTAAVEAAHRKYFAGRDKILMLTDILEREELFFVYEQGYLQKREGYYIYYEKNLAMQEYMIYKREEEMRLAELRYGELAAQASEHAEATASDRESVKEQAVKEAEGQAGEKQEAKAAEGQAKENIIKSEQFEDAQPVPKEPKTQAEEALETYRQMLLERQGKREERHNRRFLYTASSFFLVVLCVIGITTINNYRKMQEVEDVLNVMNHKDRLSKEFGSGLAGEETNSSQEKSLVVETVESQIEPLKADEKTGDEPDSSSNAEKTDGKAQDNAEETASKEQDNAEETAGKEQDNSDKAVDGRSEVAEGKSEEADKAAEGKPEEAEPSSSDEKQVESNQDSGDTDGSDSKDQSGTQETAAGGQAEEKKYYIVQPGDTLNTICLDIYKSKDMVQALKEINGIEDGDKILAGQKLLLP